MHLKHSDILNELLDFKLLKYRFVRRVQAFRERTPNIFQINER